MTRPPSECGPCGTLPSGFTRLRYFYGKRLAVADFVDEQRYHTGKLRFHNQRLHGSGVLCGLAADLFSSDPVDATILRVHRGAAVDGCGREIIVGCDQCVDVDAWLGRQLQANASFITANTTSADPTHLPLCVVLRYRECPTSPEAAPRDACGCDATGCDYGRVREEFELDLIPAPAQTIVPAIFPDRAQLLPALASSPGGSEIARQIAALASSGCPTPDLDGWIEIACFTATLTPPASATDRTHITALGTIAPAETILYETALLQELLMRDLAATVEGGSLADGPQITSITLDSATTPTQLFVNLSATLAQPTVIAQPFALLPFTSASGWGAAIALTSTSYDPTNLRFALMPPAGTFAAGALLRLVSIVPTETPMVDASMRPLLPLRFSYHLAIAKDATSGQFSITPPPITP